MFQPLAAQYTQPIAVFASKSSVKGEELAKIVVKAIAYLEQCGAMIHGIVADGATTNAKMWSLLGISGRIEHTKTWFVHPLDEKRKVFAFSDICHVIKNIRNRLYNTGKLRLKSTSDYIRWSYFEALYDLDKNHEGNARACPKITRRHVVLDTTSKMRVSLATQILENSAQQLNEWETNVLHRDIPPEEFQTVETSRALRISLRSTMDLCRYLIDEFEFHYLLTGKLNQDNLEKFFGTIRQCAGCNDHPNCPTFLQLYKLLSVYSVIKPPKYGNCTVSSNIKPATLISLSELKAIYGDNCEGKSAEYQQNIQQKLDAVLQSDDWEADDIIPLSVEHD